MNAIWIIVAAGVLAVAYGIWTATELLKADPGSPRMQEIAARDCGRRAGLSQAAIFDHRHRWRRDLHRSGLLLSWTVAIGFLTGAILSGAAGFIGMNVSVRANVRTAQAASKSLGAGLDISFKAGAVTGMLVAGLALLGVVGLFLDSDRPAEARAQCA